MFSMNNYKINDKLKTFLETNVLRTPIVRTKALNRGGASLNYKISTERKNYLLKIFDGSKLKRAKRFLLIYESIASVSNLCAANLSFNRFFSFDDHILFLMDFIDGRKLSSSDLKDDVLSQISDNYQNLISAHFADTSFLSEKLDPQSLFSKTKQNLADYSSNALFAFQKSKGENFILNKEQKLFFLDFEMVREGYLSEDLAQFVLSILLQRSIWFFNKKKFISSVHFFEQRFHLGKAEWEYGICLYFLRLATRRSKSKILKSPRKSWLFYKHLQKFEKVMDALLDCF